MTSRTLNRELIIHRDLALGSGTVLQTRGEAPETAEQLIEINFIFRDNNEIRFLDTNRYKRASIHTDGPLIQYFFDTLSAAIDDDNDVLAPIPAIAVGRWIRITSSGASLRYESVVDLIADLAIVSTIAPNTQVGVSGYYTPGDFGGGSFYWDALSTMAHDGGMVLLPTGHTDPGRWIRIITTLIDVHHFGAVGDGVTNDRTSIENAMTSAADNGLTLTIRDLSYEVAGMDLTITKNLRIIGNGFPLLLNGVKLTFTGAYVNFDNLAIIDWSGGINLEPVTVATYDFEQFSAVGCGYGVRSVGGSYDVATLRVRGGWFNGSTMRHAYYFEGKVEVVDMENVKITDIGNTGDNLVTVGIGISTVSQDAETIIIRNCQIDGLTSNNNIRCNAIQVAGDRVVIANNIIVDILGTGTGKAAIDVLGTNCVITNNSINCPTAAAGIYVSELVESTIADNQVIALTYGIQAAAPLVTYSIFDTIISNNYLNADVGIALNEAANIRIDNNIFDIISDDITGNYKYTWWFVDNVMTTTSTKLLDITDIVNTMSYKRLGTMIWDETIDQPLYADGNADGSLWLDATGATEHMPV